MDKRIIFEVSHPKHFHQFKHLIDVFGKNNKVKIVARDKDVVLKLLDEGGFSYELYGTHGKTILQKYLLLPKILKKYWEIVTNFQPDLIVSRCSPYAAIIGKITSTKILVLPDTEIVEFNNNFVVPLANFVITPNSYELNHGSKQYRVNGFFENAYLHPDYFMPNDSVLTDLNLGYDDPFFVIRFVGWSANHEKNQTGFTSKQKIKLVKKLKNNGQIFISDEGNLPTALKPYKLKIRANKIHSLLYYASLYIGDSGTMATEAALLGTPSIRYNSFVGHNDMSNFKILEKEYDLLINTSSFEDVLKNATYIIRNKDIQEVYRNRKNHYFSQTGDVNKETELYIENFLEH